MFKNQKGCYIMQNKLFFILQWIIFIVVLFAVFTNSRLGMSDTLTAVILFTGLALVVLLKIIEKRIIKRGK